MNNELLNSVTSKNQLNCNEFVTICNNNADKKVLFVGNSITRHSPKPSIGWFGDWGMAASSLENDYVHQTVSMLQQKIGPIDYCVAQAAEWERNFLDADLVLEKYYTSARDFEADVVIIRIGENIDKEDIKSNVATDCFKKMINFFAKKLNAQVIVTGSFWKNEYRDSIISSAASSLGAVYCSIADIETVEGAMAIDKFEHRGVSVHPSDLGMRLIAEHILDNIDLKNI